MRIFPFERIIGRVTALSWSAVFIAALGAACVRLLPWLLSPEVPRAVAVEFARVLVAMAGEVAYAFGLPLGAALASALLHERGEARTLFALGVSPLRIMASSWRAGLLLVALFGSVSWVIGARPQSAGVFANQLLEAGRTSCTKAHGPRSATVPLLDVSWLCFPGEPPLLVGSVPGAAGRVWFTAEAATLGSDMSHVRLRRAELAFRSDTGEQRARVRVADARVTGLKWPAHEAGSGHRVRALAALSSGVSAALTAMALTLRFAVGGRLFAMALAVLGGAASLAGLQAFEGRGSAALLVLSPLFGVLAPLALLGAACVWGRLHPRYSKA